MKLWYVKKLKGNHLPDKKERVIRRIRQRFYSGIYYHQKRRTDKINMLTLTSAPQSVSNLVESFSRLRKKLVRVGYNFEYLAIVVDDHMHIAIIGDYIPQQEISKYWENIHGAKIVDIRSKPVKKVISYFKKNIKKKKQWLKRNYFYSSGWMRKGWSNKWKQLCRSYYRSVLNRPQLIKAWKEFCLKGDEAFNNYLSKINYFATKNRQNDKIQKDEKTKKEKERRWMNF